LVGDFGILGFGIRNPTAIGIQNPSSTDRKGIQYLESGIHGMKSMREMMDLVKELSIHSVFNSV